MHLGIITCSIRSVTQPFSCSHNQNKVCMQKDSISRHKSQAPLLSLCNSPSLTLLKKQMYQMYLQKLLDFIWNICILILFLEKCLNETISVRTEVVDLPCEQKGNIWTVTGRCINNTQWGIRQGAVFDREHSWPLIKRHYSVWSMVEVFLICSNKSH